MSCSMTTRVRLSGSTLWSSSRIRRPSPLRALPVRKDAGGRAIAPRLALVHAGKKYTVMLYMYMLEARGVAGRKEITRPPARPASKSSRSSATRWASTTSASRPSPATPGPTPGRRTSSRRRASGGSTRGWRLACSGPKLQPLASKTGLQHKKLVV